MIGRCHLILLSLLLTSAVALDWQSADGARSAAINPGNGKTGFTQMPHEATGIQFSNVLAVDRYTTNQIYLNGSGVAAGDIDGDGLCDLYFCALDNNNILYRNLGGWKFQDMTADAGVACPGRASTGAALADLDGDGDLDLVVNSVGEGTDIFSNDGKGHFTKTATVNPQRGGMSLALADIDGDGRLDLYIANYRTTTVRDQPNTRIQGATVNGQMVIQRVNGRPVADTDLANRFTLDANGKMLEHGEPDVLFHNDGAGKFSPISFTGGAFLDEDGKPLREPSFDWGLSVMFRDIDGDGSPDIYVCNDFHSPDRIWLNDGRGHFRAAPRLALRHTSMFSMGVDFADVNRDGLDDFFVADMLSRSHRRRHTQVANYNPLFLPIGKIDDRPQYSFNNLQLNRGDGSYAEIAQFSGIDASDWSWTPIFLDVDLDGYEDLLITTGHERDALHMDFINAIEQRKAREKLSGPEMLNLQRSIPRLATPKAAFRNRGDLTFEEVTAAWGFDGAGVSHGMVLADLDNDGDLDIAVNSLNGPAALYRNNSRAARIAVRLKGSGENTHGIGAKIRIVGGPVDQSQEMIGGGRYLSSDDAMRAFAAGDATNLNIEVTWRNGRRSVFNQAKPNRIYEINEQSSELAAPALARQSQPLFEDASAVLNHVHHEEAFDDFARQPLLPNRLSQLGPGVCWHDFDNDGFEDLIIGVGRGGALAVYRNNGQGGFALLNEPTLNRPVARDQTAILGLGSMVLAGSANYEDGLTNGGSVRIYDLQRKASGESILGEAFSRGPLAVADVDGDGDLDLFVGGRVVPGRYPEPAPSLLLRNENGRFMPLQRFEKLGLVSGAVFSDLDGDGMAELVLACEWGPIRVFKSDRGVFTEMTERLGLAKNLGWWNGVTTGDFDGDGKLDIVASNWGLNTRNHATRARPRRLHYGDLNGSGAVDIVESHFDPVLGQEVPDRLLKTAAALPFLQAAFPTYEAYAGASLQEIYGERLKSCSVMEVNTLSSTLFLNRGDHFEPVALSPEAQFAPAFGVCAGDIDGDGNEDIFLSENFFATGPEPPRQDAGRGLCLRGDGHGAFKAMRPAESGVTVDGEQRGCALADYDRDGRVDLVVTQNGAQTRLFHNVSARPGLRVRLRGGPGNETAIGAAMRAVFGAKMGPVREIHGGSGYWSQDGAVQVLGMSESPKGIWVRWPGGKTTTTDIPAGLVDIEIDAQGQLRSLTKP
ncbi:MAG TPA: VCBS repeat-containing protein [Verrucomicrobiae bacterium]|nr:VCBS repeat-containing protein [Verrucomicrobiae bacterium]